jgi:hypothetical protein
MALKVQQDRQALRVQRVKMALMVVALTSVILLLQIQRQETSGGMPQNVNYTSTMRMVQATNG